MRSEVVQSLAVLGVAIAMGGCAPSLGGARTVVSPTAAERFPEAGGELDFLDALAGMAVVANDDALRALMLDAGEGGTGGEALTPEARLAEAVRLGWIAEGEAVLPGESVEMGLVAVVLCKVHGVEGGLSMRLVGDVAWSRGGGGAVRAAACTRYLRQGEGIGLLPSRAPSQAMTGAELLTALRRAESVFTRGSDEN